MASVFGETIGFKELQIFITLPQQLVMIQTHSADNVINEKFHAIITQ